MERLFSDTISKDSNSDERCRVCGKMFEYDGTKRTHTCSVSCLYRCCKCGETFTTNEDLKSHSARHSTCNRSNPPHSKTPLRESKHAKVSSARSYKKLYNCNICLETFTLKWQLTAHAPCHSNLKEYKCDVCEKTFDRKRTLNVHVMSHIC